MNDIVLLIDKAVAEERALMKQADVDGRVFNAQGHQQAIGAYMQCRDWVSRAAQQSAQEGGK